jgi:tRNA wybutosine-synthesizing protein 3
MTDMFIKRKQDILSKDDKSFKGDIDEKIKLLCDKINSSKDFYTTSSCSGRIALMIDQEKKGKGLILKNYHDSISFAQLKKDLNEIIKEHKEDIKFKMESCALHIACKNFEEAQELCDKAKLSGWKKTGVITSEKRFMVEISSTERLEFPVIKQRKILVSDDFLRIIVEDADKKLKKCWIKIQKLENNL